LLQGLFFNDRKIPNSAIELKSKDKAKLNKTCRLKNSETAIPIAIDGKIEMVFISL